jgi:hypothetical protein
MARRDAVGVRLITRNGNDFTNRFPLVVAVVATLLVSSCLIDGEGIVSDDDGLAADPVLGHEPLCRAVRFRAARGQDLRRLMNAICRGLKSSAID